MTYYNENDPKSSAWLRELVDSGLVSYGRVDSRSIHDVRPEDLKGHDRCHFFAGIAGWDLALQMAGWPGDVPVWTGSCPCQPFSAAGKQKGTSDDRHLWPIWRDLIAECLPPVVIGEQVPSPLGREWLSGVRSDLEALGYQVGAIDTCAASEGAPHIRQRLYWVAYRKEGRRSEVDSIRGRRVEGSQEERRQRPKHGGGSGGLGYSSGQRDRSTPKPRVDRQESSEGRVSESGGSGPPCGSGNPDPEGLEGRGLLRSGRSGERSSGAATSSCGMGDSGGPGSGRDGGAVLGAEAEGERGGQEPRGVSDEPLASGFWSDYRIIPCIDGKARRIESSIEPLATGLPRGVVPSGDPSIEEVRSSGEARVMRLRGYGNAIVPQVAATFVRAFMGCIDDIQD